MREENFLLASETIEQEIVLYPNPTQDYVNIEWTEFKHAIITDLSGNKLIDTNQKQIDLKTLSSGIYLIKVISHEDEQKTFRIILNAD